MFVWRTQVSEVGGSSRLNDRSFRMSGPSRKEAAGRRGGYTALNLHHSYKDGRADGTKPYGMYEWTHIPLDSCLVGGSVRRMVRMDRKRIQCQ